MANKNQKSIKVQIAEYLYEFQMYSEMMSETNNFAASGSHMYNINNKYLDMGWKGHRWNWDESWDGSLIALVRKLDAGGVRVSQFLRSRKIKITLEKGKTQAEMFSTIHNIIGDVAGARFSKNVIWIQLNKPKENANEPYSGTIYEVK